jgi:hypothetical protein
MYFKHFTFDLNMAYRLNQIKYGIQHFDLFLTAVLSSLFVFLLDPIVFTNSHYAISVVGWDRKRDKLK